MPDPLRAKRNDPVGHSSEAARLQQGRFEHIPDKKRQLPLPPVIQLGLEPVRAKRNDPVGHSSEAARLQQGRFEHIPDKKRQLPLPPVIQLGLEPRTPSLKGMCSTC